MDSLILIGTIVLIVCMTLSILRLRQMERLDIISVFLAGLGIYYGGLLILLANNTSENEYLMQLAHLSNHHGWLYVGLVILFAFSFFWAGKLVTKESKLTLLASWNKWHNLREFNELVLIGWLVLVVAFAFYYLYSISVGGFVGLILNAILIRGGEFDMMDNAFSFLGKFGGLSFIASFIFAGAISARPKYVNKSFYTWNIIGLVISILFSIFVIWSWWSRSHFVFYVITMMLAPFLRKFKLKISLKSVMMFLVSLLILFSLFLVITYKFKGIKPGEGQEGDRLAMDASIRILPTFVLLENYDSRYFQDIVYTPVYFLPQKIWKKNIVKETASDVLTKKMMGGKKGDLGVPGSMVIGIVPFSYLEGHIAGIIVLGFLFGILFILLEYVILVKLPPGISEAIYVYVIFRFVISCFWNADTQVIIYNNIDIISGILILFISKGILKLYREFKIYRHYKRIES